MPLPLRSTLTACLLPALGLAVTVASSALAQEGHGGPPPATVRLDAVRLEVVEDRREVTGALRATARSQVAAEVAGRVLAVLAREGDAVQARAIVARIDPTLFDLDLARARAEAERRQADVEEALASHAKAERDLPNARRLHEEQVVSDNVLSEMVAREGETAARLSSARAALREAEVAVRLAARRRTLTDLRAPFTGILTAVMAQPGAWLAEGSPACEMVTSETVEAWLDVPEAQVALLPAGSVEVTVRVASAGFETLASARVVPTADPRARTFPLRATLESQGGRLKPGMACTGLVPGGRSGRHLTVSSDAILRDDAGTFVYRESGGVAAAARVEVLFGLGERVAVLSAGLEEGALVVVDGNERLRPGQPLAPLGADATGPKDR